MPNKDLTQADLNQAWSNSGGSLHCSKPAKTVVCPVCKDFAHPLKASGYHGDKDGAWVAESTQDGKLEAVHAGCHPK